MHDSKPVKTWLEEHQEGIAVHHLPNSCVEQVVRWEPLLGAKFYKHVDPP